MTHTELIHHSTDDYKTKHTYKRTKSGRDYIVQVIDFHNEIGKNITVPVYKTLMSNRPLFDSFAVLPDTIREYQNRLYVFSAYNRDLHISIYRNVDVVTIFTLLHSFNSALILANTQTEQIKLLSMWGLGDEYYTGHNLIPVYNDCCRGNVLVADKPKLFDIDSIVLVEERHAYDAFVFNWLIVDLCVNQPKVTEKDVAFVVEFIVQYILPVTHVSYKEFIDDLTRFATASLAALDDADFFRKSNGELGAVVRYRITKLLQDIAPASGWSLVF